MSDRKLNTCPSSTTVIAMIWNNIKVKLSCPKQGTLSSDHSVHLVKVGHTDHPLHSKQRVVRETPFLPSPPSSSTLLSALGCFGQLLALHEPPLLNVLRLSRIQSKLNQASRKNRRPSCKAYILHSLTSDIIIISIRLLCVVVQPEKITPKSQQCGRWLKSKVRF